MSKYLTKFWKDQSGATAIEYGLLAAGISIAILAAVEATGANLMITFHNVSVALK
jgi:pilus assembly protein Flp/PilA